MRALDLAQQYFDAWNRHDADGIVGLFSEAGTYSDPTTGGPLQGPAIGANAAGLWASFPDLRFEIVSAAETSDGVIAAEWMMLGTNDGPMFGLPPTGQPIQLPGADFVTVRDDRIESVVGYFDSGVLPRQIGMQVLVQPNSVGPFRFGYSVSSSSQRTDKPGAFSITILRCDDPEGVEKIRDYGRQISIEMQQMQGFLGNTNFGNGGRQATITAWESPEHASQLLRAGAHSEAMRYFWSDDGKALGGWTSVWVPEHINAMWARCESCGKMVNSDELNGVCGCGATLPSFGPWW
jgi:steroid delta-isomerase-like uncharacterized protein